jgi:hypothetical protein
LRSVELEAEPPIDVGDALSIEFSERKAVLREDLVSQVVHASLWRGGVHPKAVHATPSVHIGAR